MNARQQLRRHEQGAARWSAAMPQRAMPAARPLRQSPLRLNRASCACGGTCPRCRDETKNAAMPQPKLTVNEPGDAFEQEADRAADQVMRMADPVGNADADPPARALPVGTLQRRTADASGPATAPPIVHQALRVPGQPLDAPTRAFMEPRFGADFADVRVHTDAKATESARSIDALAYTVGRDVVFGRSQFAPGTQTGRSLLAHELAHVAQQGGAAGTSLLQRQAGGPAPAPGPAPPPAPAPGPAPGPAGGLSGEMLRQIARQLREAMEGWGTDEDSIYAALSGRTPDQVNDIGRVYNDMYKRDLQADLQDELSESELKHLAAVMVGPPSQPGAPAAEQGAGLADVVAAQLDKAMAGLGTDETSIYSALTGRTVDERKAIKEAYKRRTGRELEADLRDEMSGSELNRALQLLNQGMQQPEDEIYFAVAGLGTDEATIFRVLSELSKDAAALRALEQNYNAKYGDLIADLRDDLSASEFEKARAYLNPATAQCPSGIRTISVDFVTLSGATISPATELAAANGLFSSCCIQFVMGATPPQESLATTQSWLGGDTDLNASGITCSTPTVEEKTTYDRATAAHSLSSRMRVFLVQTFSGYGAAGFSRPPYCAGGYANHIILANIASGATNPLAHEFGHILLNNGNHPAAPNLMAPTGGTVLTPADCATCYSNA